MKREPVPTLEQVAEIVRHIDLSRLTNRLVGKPLIELEHCLIEVLGNLCESYQRSRKYGAEIMDAAMSANNPEDFFSAYRDYQRERSSQGALYANFSPTGRYFQMLLDKLLAHEDKQIDGDKAVTVSHARILAVLVVRQLEVMTSYYLGSNEKLYKQWEYWMDQSSSRSSAT